LICAKIGIAQPSDHQGLRRRRTVDRYIISNDPQTAREHEILCLRRKSVGLYIGSHRDTGSH
jgi:hypothetical protein